MGVSVCQRSVMLFSKTSVVLMLLALTSTEPHPPPMENHRWSRLSGRGVTKKALFVCDAHRTKVAARDGATGAPQRASEPSEVSSTRRPLGARHGVAAPRRSAHPFTTGDLAAKSVGAGHRSAEPPHAPGPTSEPRFLPARVRPARLSFTF